MTLCDIDISGYETLLLDRDGTINVRIEGGYVCRWEDFEFIAGVPEAIGHFCKCVKRVFVVSNQRGVGRGRLSEKDLADIHLKMCAELAKYGGHIDKIYYSTAVSDDDPYRKPGRGMFDDILRDYPGLDLSKCLMVGDSDADMGFARNCGIAGIKVDGVSRKP